MKRARLDSSDEDNSQLALAKEISLREAEEAKEQDRKRGRFELRRESSDLSLQWKKLSITRSSATLYGDHLRKGFEKLFDQPLFSDLTLIVGEQKIAVHRVVLCAWSDTFRAMLENNTWQESQQSELVIHCEDNQEDIFKMLLKYMYTGDISFIGPDTVVPLLSLANYYGVRPLVFEIGGILSELVSADNLPFLLNVCETYDCDILSVNCAAFLADHFDALIEEDKLTELPLNTWEAMLKRDDLNVRSEKAVFKAVFRYCTRIAPEQKLEALTRLLPLIHFPLLSGDFLARVVDVAELKQDCPILQELLHEAFRFKVYPESVNSFRKKPRGHNARPSRIEVATPPWRDDL